MARLSNNYQAILRSVLESGKMASVSVGAELLFFKLLIVSDSMGRFYGAPLQILTRAYGRKAERGSTTIEDIAGLVSELLAVGLLEHYKTEGQVFLEVVDYYDPQTRKERKARFPENPHESPPEAYECMFPQAGAAVAPGGGENCPGTVHKPDPQTPTITKTENPKSAPVKRKPPVNGKTELGVALTLLEKKIGHALSTDFLEISERYRKTRAERRWSVWKISNWGVAFGKAVFDERFDEEAMLVALVDAANAPYMTPYPKQIKPNNGGMARGIDLGMHPDF